MPRLSLKSALYTIHLTLLLGSSAHASNIGRWASLKLNAQGVPVISCFDLENNDAVWVTQTSDTTWSQTVMEGGSITAGRVSGHTGTSLTLLSNGAPVVAFNRFHVNSFSCPDNFSGGPIPYGVAISNYSTSHVVDSTCAAYHCICYPWTGAGISNDKDSGGGIHT